MGTGAFFMSEVLLVCGAITAIGAALVVLAKGARFVLALIKKVNDFLEDWNGEPARPGIDAKPGINERISDISARLSDVEKEIKHNGGGSIKDVVHSMDDKIDTLQEAFETHVQNTSN